MKNQGDKLLQKNNNSPETKLKGYDLIDKRIQDSYYEEIKYTMRIQRGKSLNSGVNLLNTRSYLSKTVKF